MASSQSQGQPPPLLLDRQEIHKSCKQVETIINLLNDYCEATSAIVVIQKKLFKALKEAATSKGVEASCNALSSSASIFDSITETNTRFSKLADKECETVSGDVRKWFKKLAKEEKNHDERLANANAKIKNASLVYEKASKKKNSPSGAMEEHAKYMNIISTIGPEISQDKQNHAISTSTAHTSTLLGVSACLARVAELEWGRYCDLTRRLAPSIGSVMRWRSLGEGGWAGNQPPPLSSPAPASNAERPTSPVDSREGINENSLGLRLPTPPPSQSSAAGTVRRGHITPLPSPSSRPSTPTPIPAALPNVGSASPPSSATTTSPTSTPSRPMPQPHQKSNAPPTSFTPTPVRSSNEFDPSTVTSLAGGPGFDTLTSSFPTPPTYTTPPASASNSGGGNGSKIRTRKSSVDIAREIEESDASKIQGAKVAAMKEKWDRSSTPTSPSSPPAAPGGSPITRKPSNHIADLASRYDAGSPTPPSSGRPAPRDLPQRKNTAESQTSIKPFPSSGPPLTERRSSGMLNLGRMTEEPDTMSLSSSSNSTSYRNAPRRMTGNLPEEDDEGDPTTLRARRTRLAELQALQLEEQAYLLREEVKVREREKLQLQQQRREDDDEPQSSSGEQQRKRGRPYREPSYSLSFTQLPSATSTSPELPVATPTRKPRISLSSTSSASDNQNRWGTPGHDINCNCASCILNRPSHSPLHSPAATPRPTLKPEKEKKNWIRRLSMPGTFISDNKKPTTSSQAAVGGSVGYYGLRNGAGVGSRDILTSTIGEDGRLMVVKEGRR